MGRRLDDFERKGWHNRVSVMGTPKIEYVGLVNREDDTEDRAVVRITASLRAFVVDRSGRKIMRKESKSEQITLCEYWTLARSGDAAWKVVSIEQRAEGDHHLDSEIVASPWSDSRLADEALTELAVEDGLPPGFMTADLAVVAFDGTAREQALDLSLADARFAPDVLEAAARRAVAAWAEAVDGDDGALERVATPEAVRSCSTAETRRAGRGVVVRGPRVRQIRIMAVDVSREPATMTSRSRGGWAALRGGPGYSGGGERGEGDGRDVSRAVVAGVRRGDGNRVAAHKPRRGRLAPVAQLSRLECDLGN